ncbi:MAG: outer membrane lipoprotein chaperone LolA [Gammaproteobacteria bacterium]|jgi:outer membrane lipoprotein carrier protein|nr:outer membrane lipoprotein chaperone LolA [Gammaproteobacteria bacterium]
MLRLSKLPQSIAIFLLLFSLPTTADMAPAEHLVELLQGIEALHARYEQTGQQEMQTGEFWLRKPNQFRLESAPPLSQTIVSDGYSLWTHDRDLEQVIVSTLNTQAEDIPLLLFAGEPGRLKDSFMVEYFEDGQHDYFVLTPLEEGGMVVGIALAFQDDLPVKISFESAMNEQTIIHLLDVSQLLADDTSFDYQIPDGVDVIDDRRPDVSISD